MGVMDLTAMPRTTRLLDDAEVRGCVTVSPKLVLLGQLELQVRLLTGKDVPRELLEGVLAQTDRTEA
jgi:shikimate 5-dehydrogenase